MESRWIGSPVPVCISRESQRKSCHRLVLAQLCSPLITALPPSFLFPDICWLACPASTTCSRPKHFSLSFSLPLRLTRKTCSSSGVPASRTSSPPSATSRAPFFRLQCRQAPLRRRCCSTSAQSASTSAATSAAAFGWILTRHPRTYCYCYVCTLSLFHKPNQTIRKTV
jgi:hypothetical protein